jgi:hypothetical protein
LPGWRIDILDAREDLNLVLVDHRLIYAWALLSPFRTAQQSWPEVDRTVEKQRGGRDWLHQYAL